MTDVWVSKFFGLGDDINANKLLDVGVESGELVQKREFVGTDVQERFSFFKLRVKKSKWFYFGDGVNALFFGEFENSRNFFRVIEVGD